MKASSISILKKELATLPGSEVIDICMRLVKYKKENKELLSYLLFDANNELEYIRSIKDEIDLQFSEINRSQLYFAKKSIRKILKITNKYTRYSGNKQTEVELLIHFCSKLKKSGIPIKSSNSLNNLYLNQVRKIRLAIGTLHEDLQHDYLEEIAELNL
jgi:membrane-anchored protein YejM (alkaline phosphatase superfamily)